MDQEVVDYILQAQKHGLTDFEIKQNLVNAGWEATVVEQSFVFAKAETARLTPSSNLPQKPKVLSDADFMPKPAGMISQMPPSAVPAQPAMVQSNTNFPGVLKNKILWLAVILLVVVAGTAFAYYTYGYQTPAKVWSKYLSSKKPAVYKLNYTLGYSYQDPATKSPLSVTLTGQVYNDFRDQTKIQSSNNLSLSVTSAEGTISGNSKYLILGKVLYLYIGQIPTLKGLVGQNADWLKLDFQALEDYVKTASPDASKQIETYSSKSQAVQAQLIKIWSDPNLVVFENPLEKENINNIPTYHIKMDVNQAVASAAVINSIDLINSLSQNPQPKLDESQKQVVADLLKKIGPKEAGVWIGQKDSEIYQIHLALNVPSAADLSNPEFSQSVPGVEQTQAKARDAQRLSETRQIGEALQLFYNTNKGYPEGIGGVPQGMVPTYIVAYPSAEPKPADGNCAAYYSNYYYYIARGQAKTVNGVKLYPSFTVTFCLGNETGGYAAGVGELTPAGIQANIPCPSIQSNCVNSTPAAAPDLTNQISKLPFNAEFKLDFTYSYLGKVETLQAPDGAADVLDLIKSLAGSFISSINASSTK